MALLHEGAPLRIVDESQDLIPAFRAVFHPVASRGIDMFGTSVNIVLTDSVT